MERLRIAFALIIIAGFSIFIITYDDYNTVESKTYDDSFELITGCTEIFRFSDTINITNYKKSDLTFGDNDTYLQETHIISHNRDLNTGLSITPEQCTEL